MSIASFEGVGPLACLVAASIWAISVTLFQSAVRRYGPTEVNRAKVSIASVLLGATTLLSGQLSELVRGAPAAWALLVASGLIGMSVGDTALFAAVDRIGVHRTLLLQTFAPVFAAAVSFAAYGDALTARQAGGVLVVLCGVALVVRERSRPTSAAEAASGRPTPGPALRADALGWGVAFAICAAAGQGIGIVLAKEGMREIGFLPASFVRITAAALALWVVRSIRRGLGSPFGARPEVESVLSPAGLRRILLPTVLGTYVAILLMMIGIALSPAAVAAVLLATTPIFSLFVDARVSGRPITGPSLVGTVIAVAGVAVLSL